MPAQLDEEHVKLWRYLRLREMGVHPNVADVLAQTPDSVDQVAALIRKGCPPELAAEIVR